MLYGRSFGQRRHTRLPRLSIHQWDTHSERQEWKEAAKVLDSYLHFDEWKQVDEDPFYDWKLVKKAGSSLCQIHSEC